MDHEPDKGAPRQLGYLFRHLEMGGPVLENIETSRSDNGGTDFLCHSNSIRERLVHNLTVYTSDVRDELMKSWQPEYGSRPTIVFRSSTSFRIMGLCDADDPDYVIKVQKR